MTVGATMERIAPVALALLVATAVSSLLILAYGESPGQVYTTLLKHTWATRYGIGQVLFKATPLIFTGLSVALAFRAGLFNIGAEGQLLAGCFCAGLVGVSLPSGTSPILAIPAALTAAAAGGAIVGGVPGWLRARFGAHEVITTIMLNAIVAAVVLWLGKRFFFVAETTHTQSVVPGATLPSLGIAGSAANVSFLLALVVLGFAGLMLPRSRFGYELAVLGANPEAARGAGIAVPQRVIAVMALSGAVAGLVGCNYVLGYKHYFEEGMGRGMGFMGIAVALLGRGHPVGIGLAALLFATLNHGALSINRFVPAEIFLVLQAVVILALAATNAKKRGEHNS